jgi:hypothetical protein
VSAIPEAAERDSRRDVVALMGLALVAGTYWVLRYGGAWAESDSGLMAQAIRLVIGTSQLAPDVKGVYVNGFGYQTVSMAIMAFTGLDVQTLQQVVYPLVSAIVVLPAFALYRELSGSARIAALATLLLLLVPEHLFAMLRGSHERLDRAFLLTALWFLARSLKHRDDRTRLAVHAGIFLVTTYALVATNALFGMSFAAALVGAWILSRLAERRPGPVRIRASETTRLLGLSSLAATVIVLLFVVFMYPPLGPSLRALSEIPGTLLALIMGGGVAFDPYAYLFTAWVDPLAYLTLSAMNFLLLITSAIAWLWFGIRWYRGADPPSTGVWLLWLFFAAFAAQGAASIVSDRTGALQGNVQYRVFAVFAPVAAPLLAVVIARWRPSIVPRLVAAGGFGLLTVAALAKATLEPALSNKWLFYTGPEVQALRFAEDHQNSTDTWVGPDDRLAAAFDMEIGGQKVSNIWAIDVSPDIPSYIVSDVILRQSARLGVEIPPLGSRNLVYDNGEVRLYRAPTAVTTASGPGATARR